MNGDEPDYSFKAQAAAFAQSWRSNFEEASGMPYEEILKNKELVTMIDASLNQTMWDMACLPSPF